MKIKDLVIAKRNKKRVKSLMKKKIIEEVNIIYIC